MRADGFLATMVYGLAEREGIEKTVDELMHVTAALLATGSTKEQAAKFLADHPLPESAGKFGFAGAQAHLEEAARHMLSLSAALRIARPPANAEPTRASGLNTPTIEVDR